MTDFETIRRYQDAWLPTLLGGWFEVRTQCCSKRVKDEDAAARVVLAGHKRPPVPKLPLLPAPGAMFSPKQDMHVEKPEKSSKDAAATKIENFWRRRKLARTRTFTKVGLDVGTEEKRDEDDDAGEIVSEDRPAPNDSSEVLPLTEDEIKSLPIQASPRPPPGLPPKWVWPAWSIDQQRPDIEVYVYDEITETGKWCKAEPRRRIMDEKNHDAYLCCEYMWKGEIYIQDFGPHQVRKRGQRLTVFQLFDKNSNGATDHHLHRADPLNGLGTFESTNSCATDDEEEIERSTARRKTKTTTMMARWIVGGLNRRR